MFRSWKRLGGNVAMIMLCLVLLLTSDLITAIPVQAKAYATPAPAIATTVSQLQEQEAIPAWVPTLRRGSRNGYVWRLQTRLKTLGFFPYRVTGYYGSLTTRAVKNFQWAYSIRVDGIAGRITQGMLARAIVKQRLVRDTYRYRGIRYVWGGKSPSSGFDCSGFIYYMFRREGVPFSYHSASHLYRMGAHISRWRLRPGDLVFFAINRRGVVSHVGFYIGGNRFISATVHKGIAIYSLSNGYWAPHYLGARRVY